MKALTIAIATLFVCPLAVLPARADGPQTEIAIQGPWILYKDTQFIGSDGKTIIPVLIAIAPSGAIDYKDLGFAEKRNPNDMRHRPPQLTTGDGYYITNPKIYCLAFAPSSTGTLQCAPTAPSSPTDNSLPIKIHNSSKHWDWWTVAQPGGKKTAHTALILPMPDSITNDGTWPVKFAKKFEVTGETYQYDPDSETHSTGLTLHYGGGPSYFGLLQCSSTPASGGHFMTRDCTQYAATNPDRHDTHLENSGTLRIQMKAPFNADGCDMHVRMAHRQIVALLGPIAADHYFIEPGFYLDPNKIGFDTKDLHPCLSREKHTLTKKEKKLGSDHPKLQPEEADAMLDGEVAKAEESEPVLTTKERDGLVADLAKFAATFDRENTKNNEKNKNLLQLFTPGKEDIVMQSVNELKEYDPDFPRISQIARITMLLQMSEEAIAPLTTNDARNLEYKGTKKLAEGLSPRLKRYKAATKGPGDCLSTTVQVVDGP